MAYATLVDVQIREGQTLIDRLVHEKVEVTAAGWVRESDLGDWYYYLVTPLVGADGDTSTAYHRVSKVMRKMEREGFGMELIGIRVIGPSDPMAKDMVAHRSGPAGTPTRYGGSRLGNLYVDEAYLYPPPTTAEQQTGTQLWECGRTELRPGIGPAGLCRAVVIDRENQAVVPKMKKTYRGTMDKPQALSDGQLEVTWAEGGAVRIVTADKKRWRWSQPRAAWEEGGCPPDEILEAIFSAMA